MAFNVEAYSLAADEFVASMEEMYGSDCNEIGKAMTHLCDVLRIGQVRLTFYDSPAHFSDEIGGERSVFFDCGESDSSDCFTVKKTVKSGNVFLYEIFPRKGEVSWDDDERSRIDIFVKLLFTFNSKAKSAEISDKLLYFEPELEIPNLYFFRKVLETYIESRIADKYCACCFNMRRFSVVNQHVGRHNGTIILKKFVRRLEQLLNSDECVCRIGSDNFVMLFRKENINSVIEYLKGQPIVYDEQSGERVMVTTYAGYYMIPDSDKTFSSVIDSVRSALGICRADPTNDYVFYDSELVKKRSEAKLVESLFPDAIANEEFRVFYQPKTFLKNYRLGGAEALCRWFKDGEIVAPYRFIPVLEQSKLICTLDFYMLEHVCKDIRRWIDEGKSVVKVSVNLSRRHLGDVDLLDHIISIIDSYSIPHEYIEIELTETTTDVDFKDLKKIVEGLSNVGISTSVDDFGVGYSSLNLIRELPWKVLKIDKSFIPQENRRNSPNCVMLKHLIAMAQDMGLECLAEGVETLDQVKLLKENNCYLAQGFYFDKPLPVNEFELRLAALA